VARSPSGPGLARLLRSAGGPSPPTLTADQLRALLAGYPSGPPARAPGSTAPPTYPFNTTRPGGLKDAEWSALLSKGFVAEPKSAAAQQLDALRSLAAGCQQQAEEIVGYLLANATITVVGGVGTLTCSVTGDARARLRLLATATELAALVGHPADLRTLALALALAAELHSAGADRPPRP
jgi:hypothetical protein